MRISLLSQFLFLCIMLTFWSTDFTLVSSQCLDDQKALLVELKDNLIFDSSLSGKLVQWNQTEDCCTWNGVECDDAGHVVSLELDGVGISGGIENSSSLFGLSYLEKLNLAFNNFNGSQIPRGIHNLTRLTHLNLSYAGFGGQVPIELSLMQRLISLDLSCESWSDLPLRFENPNMESLLHNLTYLRELNLDGVNISTPVPTFVANFSRLTTLSLRGCSLQGIFPEMIFQVPTLKNLDLSSNVFLSGTLPQFLPNRSFRTLVLRDTNFSGSLPDSISNFSMLSEIDLSNCKFNGRIPSSVGKLTELVRLQLSYNLFTGQIPSLYMSKKLTLIDLSNNSLTGSLSSMHLDNRRHLNLVYINLGSNLLTGKIPMQSLFCLPSLQELVLFKNQFSGQLNEFSTLQHSNISWLDLGFNRLEGPIPESLLKLEKLVFFSLSHNFFNGTFELERLQRLRGLSVLDLSYNNLSVEARNTNSSFATFPQLTHFALASCNLSNVPEFIINQSQLSTLDLSINQIPGKIPSWIWDIGNGGLFYLNLSFNLFVDLEKPYNIPSVRILDLNSNQLQGELPMLPPEAQYIDYSNNNFEKSIQHFQNFTSSLKLLNVANNSLSGAIPASLCNAIDLEILDLSVNNFGGTIPPCLVKNMTHLGVLNVGRNNISGDIPNKFSLNCSLQTLDLSYNNLGGNIPVSLENCKSLEVMNVGNNNIRGIFPCTLSPSLRVLVLRSNMFHGHVRCQKGWKNLQIIDIASNNFSGYLYSRTFLSWRGMMLGNNDSSQLRPNLLGAQKANGGYYQDRVSLVAKGQMQEYVKILTLLTSVDFSCNNFHGEIPDEIGRLISLYNLNLSHNSVTGTMPRSIGNLMQLGSLDLSMNQLKGEIPKEITRLTFLSVLNLSYNKLVGPIPNGRQIQTFSEASFEGNTGLCGFPLNRSCKHVEENGGETKNVLSDQKAEIEWRYVCAAVGFVVGLGSIIWLLFGFQSLNEQFSERVDRVLEKLFDRQKKRRRQVGRVVRNQVVRRHQYS